jgi:hypothetical protein
MRTPFPETRIEEVPETRIEEAGGKAAILLAAHKAGHGRRIEEAGGKAAILLAAHKAGHGRRIAIGPPWAGMSSRGEASVNEAFGEPFLMSRFSRSPAYDA